MSFQKYINSDIDVSGHIVDRAHVELSEEFDKQNDYDLKAKERKYDKQFYSMYQYRLSILKQSVDNNALNKWGDGTKKVNGQTVTKRDKILDISSGQLCWVSGTIFSDMKNKLNILQDVENGVDDVLPKVPETYTLSEVKEMPVVMLEDESGRAILNNDDFLKKNILVTGCIVAILGIEIQAGIFEIMDVVYPSVSPQKPLVAPKKENSKIAFVSGLKLCDEANHDIKIELLKQYLTGELGCNTDTQAASYISRLVIAGDSIAPIEETVDDDFFTTNNYGSKNISKFNTDSLKSLDKFITDLLPSVPISIMPGNNDPAEICLPQQPLHKSIFSSNKRYVGGSTLQTLTNPTWMEVQESGLRLLGTSGQNISDILKYLTAETLTDPQVVLTIMESNIKWQNIIPTAPDTLYCYPFDNADPFTLADETPHVYFVGNQKSYHTKTINLQKDHDNHETAQITLISIPDFSQTGQIVLLDLTTLECELVSFNI
ncbi:DEHA2G20350p [Debaryomyces hansenii CBS767]|uniref:DNA-directed DNA polymerase n=1 Tax=Debaryomyces hansenii (strain ATCC 36239 / CBS 767 / BCRC 21394 / JCM 1990 / NBRC 0083 / IGC 2968) TaxID=284592 RepID=Q6BH94_DEBHA|nr:DEHA2G20350p [Debaryomyces hansenii CBS767]CAG90937.2 DEHA2G20350p [Debaryomyces hansenii CBS767]|eukprot:XP_462427.2 DEHA2G20350p [Debaryomyces hansenii CBS767]